MKRKLYFKDVDAELCYTEDYFLESMDPDETEVEVLEAVHERIGGIFWCKEHGFCGDDTKETCGRDNCDQYEPRNKVSGCCMHHTHWLYTHGDKVILLNNTIQ